MRCALAVFCVLTIMPLAVDTAQADSENIFYNNWDNGGGNYVPGTEFFNPNATTDGAVWKKIGTDAPVFNPDDFTLEAFVKMADNSFVSMGSEDTFVYGYPGYFFSSHSHATPDGGLAGSYGARIFVLKTWVGDYDSFEAACAAGAYCGITPEFVNPAFPVPMLPPSLTQMPALILRQTLPGDANFDGTVNIADLSKVLTNYDKSGMMWYDGDFDANGTVNISDLSKVLTNYDKTFTAGGVTAVPEPGALALLAAAMVGTLAYGWRKRR